MEKKQVYTNNTMFTGIISMKVILARKYPHWFDQNVFLAGYFKKMLKLL